MINLNDFCLYSITATGYHTGATDSMAVLIPREILKRSLAELEKVRWYFGDLDGEHSETLGTVEIRDLRESWGYALTILESADNSCDCMREILTGCELGADEITYCLSITSQVKAKLGRKTIVTYEGVAV